MGTDGTAKPVNVPQHRQPDHRGRNILLGMLAAALLLGTGAAIESAGRKTGAAAQPGPTVTVTVTVTATPRAPRPAAPKVAAGPGSVMSADGVYVVGVDIRRGTWHTAGAVGGSGGDCYVALLSSTSTQDIIDNNNVTGPDTITVGPGVKAVQVSGCLPWKRL